MTMLAIETDIEVSVEDCEGASVDFELSYSHGIVEVTLEGYTCTECEIEMLGYLKREEVYNLGELKQVLERNDSFDAGKAAVNNYEPAQKLELLKSILLGV